MLKTNFHTHTYRCKHAGGSEQDLVDQALLHNLTVLGFSEHGPYPDNRFGLRMDYADLEDHVTTVKKLQSRYQEQLTIHLGLEIEYDPSQSSYYHYLKNSLGIEYLALGQHLYVNPHTSTEFINIYAIENTQQYVDYAYTLCDAMRSGYFSFVAHPDVIFINDLPWDIHCEKACDLIINCAKELGIPLEFNANGIRRGLTSYCDGERYPYPHKRFWDKVSQIGVPTLINSDCHDPTQLWDHIMDEAYALAHAWGLHIINEL